MQHTLLPRKCSKERSGEQEPVRFRTCRKRTRYVVEIEILETMPVSPGHIVKDLTQHLSPLKKFNINETKINYMYSNRMPSVKPT